MIQSFNQDLVQPSLLDRLTDLHPQHATDSGSERVLSVRRLREAILRDVTWLLNTSHLDSVVDLRAFPQIAASTLNYGVATLHGHSMEGVDLNLLRQMIVTSLRRFEPRLLPGSLHVEALDQGRRPGSLHFRIEADLWAEPVPLRMIMRTELDQELDAIRVVEARAESL
ncbi:type VI secretion system baseplate subunit TssE [Roseomonas marmotae]|uniref:Type VI secretion system baseplate subunit TssE n=1 Tax=Roseomonas marmotae TaxID=2768161 RepID=A0ABS3K8B5_9PROT|nr:type VI secretion system baseplate subunit TssE [Roseomonas marmotae]MBO1073703.1 type VI secretion system baseplate subunit TssE [Roseomonas marmotae]QTI78657.1 type VI secretion system baseplate subunit TssE [Roseomonas marmotae]